MPRRKLGSTSGWYGDVMDRLRMLQMIHERIVAGDPAGQMLTAASLARDCGLHRVTVMRMLRWLRQLGAPLVFDRARGQYLYRRPWDLMQGLRLALARMEVQPAKSKRHSSRS